MNLFDEEATRPRDVVPEKPMFLDAPEHPLLARFAAYLESKRGPYSLVDRADIDPAELRPFLPHMTVLDVVAGGEDFRVRVFGTALVELMHEERTGQLISEFGQKPGIPTDPVELRNRWLTICKMTAQNGRTLFFKAPTVSPQRAYMVYHGLFAPVTAGTSQVTQVFGMMVAVSAR